MAQSNAEKLREYLERQPSTKYIRLQWIDYSGVLRTRFIPIARVWQIALGAEEYRVPQVSMITPISTAPRSFPMSNNVEIWVLHPDWSSLRCCSFRPSHASIMCFVEHKEAEDTFEECPRTMLHRAIKKMEEYGGATILAGFEIEFTLLNQQSKPLEGLDRLNSYQTSAGLRGRKLDIVEEILDKFDESKIKIQHFHTETRDQIEFALSPEPLLDAVDSLVLAQETIRTVFVRNNIKATMSPKPLLDGPTNGIHMHISIDEFGREGTKHFLAGILEHLIPLCAFGMANFDSYSRATKDAAGSWVGFGAENRDLPVRQINEKHWEFRMMDATSNPYLFAAAVILSGLRGCENRSNLTWNNCKAFPHSLNENERKEFGLLYEMPKSLREAVQSLKAHAAEMALPEGLLRSYIHVKEIENEKFQTWQEDERRLRLLEYF